MEDKLYMNIKQFYEKHQLKVASYIGLLIIILFIRDIPYLNLVLRGQYLFILLWIVATFLFQIKSKVQLVFVYLLYLLGVIMLIFNYQNILYKLDTLLYLILFYTLVSELLLILTNKEKNA